VKGSPDIIGAHLTEDLSVSQKHYVGTTSAFVFRCWVNDGTTSINPSSRAASPLSMLSPRIPGGVPPSVGDILSPASSPSKTPLIEAGGFSEDAIPPLSLGRSSPVTRSRKDSYSNMFVRAVPPPTPPIEIAGSPPNASPSTLFAIFASPGDNVRVGTPSRMRTGPILNPPSSTGRTESPAPVPARKRMVAPLKIRSPDPTRPESEDAEIFPMEDSLPPTQSHQDDLLKKRRKGIPTFNFEAFRWKKY
jgi:hypothetical protein